MPVWETGVPRDESADLAKVAELGFDWHVERGDPSAEWRAKKLPERRALVVIEYDGPAWQARLADVEKTSKPSSVKT
jgi:hypothetical protein